MMQDDFKRPLGDTVREQPTKPEETPPQRQEPVFVKPKKTHSKAFSFVSILLLLAILGIGVMAYFWYDTTQQLDQANADKVQLAADAAVAVPENTPAVDPGAESPVASTDDKTLITNAVIAAFRAPVSAKDVKPVVTIMKQGAEFAYVGVGPENAGGYTNILKKVEGTWTIVYSGQEKPSQTVIDTFGIPADYQTGE